MTERLWSGTSSRARCCIRKLWGWVGGPPSQTIRSREHVRRCAVTPTVCRCSAPRAHGRVSDGRGGAAATRRAARCNSAKMRLALSQQK